MTTRTRPVVPLMALSALLALAGCMTPPEEINRIPQLSPVGYGVGDPKSVYTYPEPAKAHTRRYSLWDDRQSKFFTDARALRAGDILTVEIRINDRARFRNENQRERTATRGLGLGASVSSWPWTSAPGSAEFNVESDTATKGSGTTNRSEEMRLQIAAVVTYVLPNGNLVINGSQEVLVNAEMRVLTISGIVRPSDIGAANTVSYERIAEARISYGGRGRISEVQQPPYGQQLLDNVLPF
ncbi:flagellar basal body L-ring protein FlgH [Aquamicrobium zhengzhouense]|uniref:Flagellar L-ring protein n=1 Tax=Aquamicrobium zhengzhouense TaxID=2781738 RepID=A0ABS0S8X1_9HYPH|nr:flagellar basal body L-ring protein FlgH [Aquamicrobium zhengzhouense]MBI1619743.1 flagellar basal body L-ring protein FlgH [Aquamicrobium zhengzhouense]